jgi:repressor LexA
MGRTPTGETRRKVFEFVRDRLLAGQPPTIREVQDAFGFRAVQTARQHLERLVEDGRLVAGRHKARGYRLPGAAREPRIVLVPMLGRVPAGALDEAIEDPDGYLPVDARGAAAGDLFALRVRGESMTGAGILPGDLVIVRRQPTAANGDVVVARVGDEATVKTFRPRGRQVELRPENPAFEPIVFDAGEVVILGKVVEVRRILDPRCVTHA